MPCLLGGRVYAGDSAYTRSDIKLWSLGVIQQPGPGDDTFYGLRATWVGYCDDDSCHTPITMFWGGEVLGAPEGGIARGIASFSILSFPFGPRFKDMTGRSRASFWFRPTAAVDYLWDLPDSGLGVSVGFGAEVIFRPTWRTQLALGWDRFFSTVLGSRNQMSLAFRWGIREKKRYPPRPDPGNEPNQAVQPPAAPSGNR